jgi:4-amino-4-deoxy-L-arabinose transferase-like glycosyltransferase
VARALGRSGGHALEISRGLRRGPGERRSGTGATAILVYLALLKVVVHLLTAGNYGYFRDEFYYVAAGERLDLGYVEFPPFVAVVADISRFLLGDSQVALRFLPALAGALVVVLAGLMARELGGGRFAQGLAALATLVAPTFLAMGTFLSMDAFDQLFWASAAYVLLLILGRDRPRLWILFGLVAGLGLLTKVTMLFFGFAVFVALLLAPARRHPLTPWPWLGGAIAFVFLIPYVFWQTEHGWPTLEFWGNYGGKVAPTSPAGVFVQQVLTTNPATLPIWLAGLYYYLFSSAGKPYRSLGWIYVLLFALFALQNAKFYFLAPAYPMLFAAGGVVIERFVRQRGRAWLKPAYASILVVSGVVIAPLTVVPVLPVETLASITGAAGGDAGIKQENREVAQLPQNFAETYVQNYKTA